jgi:two-component system CheB/CheR fusion protein
VLVVKWKETGGPAVREPAREGFGSELLRRQLHHELSGDVAMIFHQGGLEATLRIPARESVVDARASLVS